MPVQSLSDILSTSLINAGAPRSANLDDLAQKVIDKSLDQGARVDDVVRLAQRAGVTTQQVDAVLRKVLTGTGDWKDTKINPRMAIADVLSRAVEGLERAGGVRPAPEPQRRGTIDLPDGKSIDDLSAQDRKYVEAFEKAGIRAGLTGQRDTISADAMTKMLDVASNTRGLSLKEFLTSVIPESPDLGFFGVTTEKRDNAAAVLLTAADKFRAASAKAKDHASVNTMDELFGALLDKKNRSKAEISGVYNAMDAIYLQDPTAAAPKLRQILQDDRIGASLRGRYDFHLNYDGSKMIVDPYIQERPRMRAAGTRGVASQLSALGGRELMLMGDKFESGKWEQKTLRELAAGNARFKAVMDEHRFDLDAPRDVLVVRGEKDDHPIYLVFSKTGDGVLSVCEDCAFHEFADGAAGPGGGGGGPIMVRKPVIYLYPTRTQPVTVSLEVAGEMLVEYPARNRGNSWEMIASPSGELFEPKTEKRYSYLFWEAERSSRFAIDLAKSYRVRRDEVASFLERVATAYALTDRERTDFVSYWIAPMRANGTSIVQLANEAEYTRYAKLEVFPAPDTVIRLFMIFRRAQAEEQVGSPPMPQLARRGFTVVEWGGSNLDEIAEVRR